MDSDNSNAIKTRLLQEVLAARSPAWCMLVLGLKISKTGGFCGSSKCQMK